MNEFTVYLSLSKEKIFIFKTGTLSDQTIIKIFCKRPWCCILLSIFISRIWLENPNDCWWQNPNYLDYSHSIAILCSLFGNPCRKN